MQYRPSIPYPDSEAAKLDLLEKLFREWHEHFASNSSKMEKHVADDMVFDGFYPNYFSQKKRLLFIGWEPVDIAGCHYIDILYRCYRHTKRVGYRHLNQSAFHYRMIYIAYGILNGMPIWQDIPFAGEIGDTFAEPTGLSFAYMNISKLSNERWQADHDVINAAYALSTQPRNFIREEVRILEPHVIIGMNLGDKIGSLGQLVSIHSSAQANSYWMDGADNRSLLINTSWHFSAWAKGDVTDYYIPICDAIRRSETGIPEQEGSQP